MFEKLGAEPPRAKQPLVDTETSKLCPQTHGRFDYLVTRRDCRNVGVEVAFTPECPESDIGYHWELVCVSAAGEGNAVFMYWRRYRG